MKLKNLYLVIILLLGEGIIITAFNYYSEGYDRNLVLSNMAVASLIFWIFAIELMNPIINLKDETQAAVGGIGIRWVFLFIFVAGSIAIMVNSFNSKDSELTKFWLFEAALLMLLVLGLYFSRTVTEKVAQVYHEEKKMRSQLNVIKSTLDEIIYSGQTHPAFNPSLDKEIKTLKENLRYLSPSNNPRAEELETQLLEQLQNFKALLLGKDTENQNLNTVLNHCGALLNQRKQLYSN